jgi:hypothetical protein
VTDWLRLKARFLRYCAAVTIPSKEQGMVKLVPLSTQTYLIDEVFDGLAAGIHDFVILKARQLGACLNPNTRVLTSDLRWVPLESVGVGDELLGVDEHPARRGAGRKMRRSVVVARHEVFAPAFRIVMDNGESMIATAEHLWLCKKRGSSTTEWRAIKPPPSRFRGRPKTHLHVGDEIRAITRPWGASTFDDGWFGGFLDGEGSIRAKRRAGAEMTLAQVAGPILDRAVSYLKERAYTFRVDVDKRPMEHPGWTRQVVYRVIMGRMAELFRLAGQTRPTKLLSWGWWEGKELPGKRIGGLGWHKVVSIDPLPPQRMLDLQTTTSTYIAEGFVSHNSTILWALDLFWLTTFKGLQGMYVADDEPNKEIHRDVIGQMYLSIKAPRLTRGPFRAHNRLESTWHDTETWDASRLMWAFANKKKEGQLGRSRGVNYIHGTEMDSWGDESALGALDAARAMTHPRRLYVWEGTGQGFGVLYQMWEQAETSVTTRRIFIGWWRLTSHLVTREQRALWEVYGAPRPTPDEKEWAAEVKKRYAVDVTRQQLCWWRWTLAEGKGINGDLATMMQEHPWLPEQAFQASGSAFLSPTVNLRLRQQTERAPRPTFYRYEWGATFDAKGDDALVEVPAEASVLTVYEEAVPNGLYIVAGDPAYGSSEDADSYAVTVWRAHPDALVQVAEYHTTLGTMYQFAWVLAHLASYYPKWLIYDIQGPGTAVMQELKRMAETGFGLTQRHGALQNVIGNIQHYLWTRADALSPSFSWGWKTSPGTQEALMEQLRNEVERGALVVRSRRLADELAALRREGGRIEAGGVAHDDLAVTAAMAVEYWLGTVQQEIEGLVADHAPPAGSPKNATELLIRRFMRGVTNPEPGAGQPKQYGLKTLGPGR